MLVSTRLKWLMIAIALPFYSEGSCQETPPSTAGQESRPSSALFNVSEDLLDGVPADFPRFHVRGEEQDAQWLSRYLWYHFNSRLGNGKTLFNEEYLATSDLWLGGAIDRKRKKPIQEIHREDLLAIEMDSEGYVHSHQHPSHAHDGGWPFPLWTQAGPDPDGVRGVAAGWHFQDTEVHGWAGDFLRAWNRSEYSGQRAADLWEIENLVSEGIIEERWSLQSTGKSPKILTPKGTTVESQSAPYLQLRWSRSDPRLGRELPYVEWLREGDRTYSEDRRVYFGTDDELLKAQQGTAHSHIVMYRHPLWDGKIKRIRISLAPTESDVHFEIDSFFTVFDTRHSINNPILVLASWDYFKWTGDLAFLKQQINRMRVALRYQQTVMGGLEHNHVRNTWPNHDGIPGWVRSATGELTMQSGHGIGSNYWDLMPFGWDDMVATSQYYASLIAIAEAEEAILQNPGWGIPRGALALVPRQLRDHAARVKSDANRLFWDDERGRFIASIDKSGRRWDYGYTFVNLESIWYGIATPEHAKTSLDWISGKRLTEGETSTGEDIYRWRFGPRASTVRNVQWYGQGWTDPAAIPFGDQIQDGGAVLGFAFYDLWARLNTYGPEDAWARLQKILQWEREVWSEGGYRDYYKEGKHGTTLQGGGTPGGLGIDFEFFESSLIPAIMVHGFLGLRPGATALWIEPNLPQSCPEMGMTNLLYRGSLMNVLAEPEGVVLEVETAPQDPIPIRFKEPMYWAEGGVRGEGFLLERPGVYRFQRVKGVP